MPPPLDEAQLAEGHGERRFELAPLVVQTSDMVNSAREPELEVFCRQVRARSAELQEAMAFAADRGLISIAVALLRQELDSLVRVMYLLAQSDRAERTRLVADAVNGVRWQTRTASGKTEWVTDKLMVEIADGFSGWARNVYRFGCAVIHLSNLHDHQARDPFQSLEFEDREVVSFQLNHYHGANLSSSSTFTDVAPWIPAVLGKVSTSLDQYLKYLEEDSDLMS